MLNDFYRNKTVLVTGHTGFKGSWMVLWLLHLGAKVFGYALGPKSDKDHFSLLGLKDHMEDIRGDIRDSEAYSTSFREVNPDILFHFAAQPLVKLSYTLPRVTYETNVMGTINTLDNLLQSDTCDVGIFITSDKCYENNEWCWGYREGDRLGGYDPYSSSKACAELAISSYRRSFNKKGKYIASVRAGNVIGGGDWSKDRIVPDCVRAIEENKTIEIRNPQSRRPWQHVLEPISGYLKLGSVIQQDREAYCSAWNFGPTQENIASVKDVVEAIISEWGAGSWQDVSDAGKHEAGLLSLDVSKARRLLDWRPVFDFSQSIEKTVAWYKHYSDSDVFQLSLDQIKDYELQRKY